MLQAFVKGFQEVCIYYLEQIYGCSLCLQRKARITEADVDAFMDATRKIDPSFGKSPAQP